MASHGFFGLPRFSELTRFQADRNSTGKEDGQKEARPNIVIVLETVSGDDHGPCCEQGDGEARNKTSVAFGTEQADHPETPMSTIQPIEDTRGFATFSLRSSDRDSLPLISKDSSPTQHKGSPTNIVMPN